MIICPSVLAGMSHEMRTHMNAIVAFSFLMNRAGCSESEREDFCNQILTSCEQLIGLFDNFFDSALIDTTEISKADHKTHKLNKFLDKLLSEFREVLQKEAHKDVVLVSETSFCEPIDIYIDSDRVFRVIRNLFQNALNNTKSGYIKIGYYFRDDQVTFYVLDSGNGYFKYKEFLNTDNLNESLNKYNDTVSAINLTLARKLIHILNGSIWIECNGLTNAGIYFSVPVKVSDSSDIKLNNYINSMIAI
ncbi:MAG: sensor histidine kinase [Bacteroidales bacterium]|jgi:signal transduction histidine kinase